MFRFTESKFWSVLLTVFTLVMGCQAKTGRVKRLGKNLKATLTTNGEATNVEENNSTDYNEANNTFNNTLNNTLNNVTTLTLQTTLTGLSLADCLAKGGVYISGSTPMCASSLASIKDPIQCANATTSTNQSGKPVFAGASKICYASITAIQTKDDCTDSVVGAFFLDSSANATDTAPDTSSPSTGSCYLSVNVLSQQTCEDSHLNWDSVTGKCFQSSAQVTQYDDCISAKKIWSSAEDGSCVTSYSELTSAAACLGALPVAGSWSGVLCTGTSDSAATSTNVDVGLPPIHDTPIFVAVTDTGEGTGTGTGTGTGAGVVTGTGKCWWMSNQAAPNPPPNGWPWIEYPDNATLCSCYQADSCSGGLRYSGGGCYKWTVNIGDPQNTWPANPCP